MTAAVSTRKVDPLEQKMRLHSAELLATLLIL